MHSFRGLVSVIQLFFGSRMFHWRTMIYWAYSLNETILCCISFDFCLLVTVQNIVEVDDFRRARPDTIAQSAAKIISHIKAGGEKAVQALKSLCWICKGIRVEVRFTDPNSMMQLKQHLRKFCDPAVLIAGGYDHQH